MNRFSIQGNDLLNDSPGTYSLMHATQSDIRHRIRKIRDQIHHDNYLIKEKIINQKLIKLCEKHNTIAVYLSIKNEVNLAEFITYALSQGKVIAAPKIIHNDMTFYKIESLNHLTYGQYNIPEPHLTETIEEFDAIFIPLIACDHSGNRIGMGKGFYDRFLSKYNTYFDVTLIGIGWDFQLLNQEIIPNEWDIPLNQFISENLTKIF